MSDKQTRLSRWSMRNLVRLYPRSFRERFGKDLLQTFSDLIDDLSEQGRNTILFTVACVYDAWIAIVREWLKVMATAILSSTASTRLATILYIPFLAIVIAALTNAQMLSAITVDGQQLSGIGRLLVFGSVLFIPVSFLVNLGGMLGKRDGMLILATNVLSVSLTVLQLLSMALIGIWIVAESAGCAAGICD